MKKNIGRILSLLVLLSIACSASVLAAEKQAGGDLFKGLFSKSEKSKLEAELGVSYRGHIQNKGDWPLDEKEWVEGPDPLGTRGQSLRVEGFWIKLTGDVPQDAGINYQVHVQNKGWIDPVTDGDFAGSKGQSLRVESIKINLINLPDYEVHYRGHV